MNAEEKNRRDLAKALADAGDAIVRAENALKCCKRDAKITRAWDYLSAAQENVADAVSAMKGE